MKPKKLNLKEIHRLYLVLKHALPEKEEVLLIDQVDEMLNKISPSEFMESLSILYKQNPSKKNDIELFLFLIRGLRENNFFEYAHFVKGLNGRH